jgi:hypothetical protein
VCWYQVLSYRPCPPLTWVDLKTHPMTGLCMAGTRQTVGQILLCLGRAVW